MTIARITPGEILFSLKTFVAALLALAIAFAWELRQPYWALLTVLIVAQPYTGMVRSKSLYRFVGTFVGAAMAVFLVPRLVDMPVLLTMALASWVALCLYLSLIDATPRSYAFILAGYTVALIGFPSVLHPDQIFFVALARVEEVCLGILSTFLVNELFFPRSALALYAKRLSALQAEVEAAGRTLADDSLDRGAFGVTLSRLYLSLSSLGPLSLFAAYDAARPEQIGRLERVRGHLSHVLPLFSEILRLRESLPGEKDSCQTVAREALAHLREFLARPGDPPPGLPGETPSAHEFPGPVHGAMQGGGREPIRGPLSPVCESLLSRLLDVRILISESRLLWHRESPRKIDGLPPPAPYRDHDLAALSAAGIFVTILAITAFWRETSWPDGATATMMAAVASSFFAAMDDPAPAILRFLGFITAGSAIGILMLYALLPMAENFLELSLCLALVLLPAGIFLGRPERTIDVLAFSIGFGGLLALSSAYHSDFVSSINAALAQSAGIGMAAVFTRLLRSVGVAFGVRRIFHANMNDLAALLASPEGKGSHHPPRLGAIFSRMAPLAIRLGALPPADRERYSEGLLHAGLARTFWHLTREGSRLSKDLSAELRELFGEMASFLREKASRRRLPETVRLDLDRKLHDLSARLAVPFPEVSRLLREAEILLPSLGMASASDSWREEKG
ncbi:MAG: FUSC family protein [Leptospirillia bacterium]